MDMPIRTVDASLMPPDAEPIANRAASEYLEYELAKLSLLNAVQLCRAVNYASTLHGELTLRDVQIACEVAAILRQEGK
jgi:hypothetical protein